MANIMNHTVELRNGDVIDETERLESRPICSSEIKAKPRGCGHERDGCGDTDKSLMK